MKKLMGILFFAWVLSGCASTNPPDAPKAKGNWIDLTTNLKDIQAK